MAKASDGDTTLAAIRKARRDRQRADDEIRRSAAAAEAAMFGKARRVDAQAERKRQAERDRRVKADLANLKLDPIEGRSPAGAPIRVNRNTGFGHLLALHRQHPLTWTKPMIDAGSRFSRDYDLSEFRGLSGMGLEPKVDSSGAKDVAATGIVARNRLRDLQARIGEESFAIMVLVCGIGFTFTDLHAQGMGDKRSLSDQLRLALNRAAAFYSGHKEQPMSAFLSRAHRLITVLKNSS